MQKGIVMQVQLYITGEDAPAHDFTQTGHDVALQVLQQGLQHYSGPYGIQVQKLQPVEGGGDDDESSSGDALNVKPLLSYTPSGAPSSGQAPETQSSAAVSNEPSASPTANSGATAANASSSSASSHTTEQPSPQQPEEPQEPHKHHFWEH